MVFRNSLAAILVLAVMAGWACADCPSSDLNITLTLQKYVFEIGEKVEYEITITNISGAQVSIQNASWPYAGHRIEVRDAEGNSVPIKHTLSGFFHYMSMTQYLASGESTKQKYSINPYAVITRPGTYTATAYARVRSEPFAVVSENCSAPVTFTVVASTEQSRNERFNAALDAISKADARDTKQRAVDDLGFTLDPRAIPELLKLARNSDTGYPALTSLLMFEGEPARSAVLADLRENGTMGYDTSDLMKGFKITQEQMSDITVYWLRHGDVVQRANAINCLNLIDSAKLSKSTRRYIHGLLRDPESQIRSAAVSIMQEGKYGVKYNDILSLVEKDPSNSVRGSAALTLLRFRGQIEWTVLVLKKLLDSPNQDLIARAAFALRAARTPSAKAVLEEGAKSADPKVKAACENELW